MKNIVLILAITFAALFFSCSTEPPPPDDNNNQHLEYEWVVDTLNNPNGYGVVPWSMWGSSDSSVWIAGFNLAGQGELFHWDGKQWNRVTPDLGLIMIYLQLLGLRKMIFTWLVIK